MTPTLHEFGGIKIGPGPERPKGKEKHVHAYVSGGIAKISLEHEKPVLLGIEGKPNQVEVDTALEQAERYYDDLKENYEKFHSGQPFTKTVGQKVEGKNRKPPTSENFHGNGEWFPSAGSR